MNSFNLNINPEEIIQQKESETQVFKPKISFDEKNYLQARLKGDENYKTMTVRFLPFSETDSNPFHKVHMHTVKVSKEVSPSGWKTFVCPKRNGFSDECPFCEVAEEANKRKQSATLEAEKKRYGDIAYSHKAKDMWVIRCIERGHEDDGVKFWLISKNVYDKIYTLFLQRFNRGKELGKPNNIFDLNSGKDLILTLTRDSNGKTVTNVADDDERTPLSSDYDKAMSWIQDSKKWENVFTVKPYEYMAIVMEGGVPKYDVDKKCYVDKVEADKAAEKVLDDNLPKQDDRFAVTSVSEANIATIDDLPNLPF